MLPLARILLECQWALQAQIGNSRFSRHAQNWYCPHIRNTSHSEQPLKFHTTLYTTIQTLTILHMEVQRWYFAVQYIITNYYLISVTKYRLQLSSLTLTHGLWWYPPITAPRDMLYLPTKLWHSSDPLGNPFLIGGDWNAKHTAWEARLITSKWRN